MCDRKPFSHRVQRGVSLIELMIGIVVALLVSLAAAGSAVLFNASQRQGMAAGGATINSTTTLAALKEDIAQAGLGFFGDSDYLCNGLNLSIDARNLSQASFSPLQVTRDANNNDQLDVVYAGQVAGGANVLLQVDATATTAQLQTFLPVSVGQAVLLSPSPAAVGAACTVRTVTAVTASTATTPQMLTTESTGTHNQVAFAAPVTYAAQGRVALLGSLAWHRYRVSGTDLLVDRMLPNTSAVLMRNVMALRVEYGAADAGQTTIAGWQEPTLTWAALSSTNIERVRALRIGIVTRSAQVEKRDNAGNCVASESTPTLFGDTVTVPGTDWACYRYRVATVVVPLRNFVMGLR